MPTSDARKDHADKKHNQRLWPRIIHVAIFVAAAIAIDCALGWVLIPFGDSTEATWEAWRNAKEDRIDTVIVGSSYAQLSIDPAQFDAQSHMNSFNLATSAQTPQESADAARTAIAEHHVKRVIYGLNLASMQASASANRSAGYALYKSEGQGPGALALNMFEVMREPQYAGKGYSIAFLTPWTFQHVAYTASDIRRNVDRRLSTSNAIEASPSFNNVWKYQDRGFGGNDSTMDPDELDDPISDSYVKAVEWTDENVAGFRELAQVCKDNDVELYVVVTPRPAYTILEHGKVWIQCMRDLSRLTRECGGTFIDMNLAKPDLYRAQDDDWFDPEHLNLKGSAAFSRALGSVVANAEKGVDQSSSFFSYDNWDEYRASLEGLMFVDFETTPAPDGASGLIVNARSCTGNNVSVEYQFSVLDGSSNTYKVVQAWSDKASCHIKLAAHGVATVRVDARIAGSTAPQHHRVRQVSW